MNVDMTSVLVPKSLPERTKGVKWYISLDENAPRMTSDEFWEFSQENPNMRAELKQDGEVILMPPTGFDTGDQNMRILIQLGSWAIDTKSGIATESNTGFVLPNGAIYAPDAAWTLKSRLEIFTDKERSQFLPLCPDFVLELRSTSNPLRELQAKMKEYIDNGARLGWLIDPQTKQVHIYRPDREPEILENPSRVSGEDVLPGFELDLTEVW